MGDIAFACSHCGQHIAIDESAASYRVQCPTCQGDIVVPRKLPAPHQGGVLTLWISGGVAACILLAALGFWFFYGGKRHQVSPGQNSSGERVAASKEIPRETNPADSRNSAKPSTAVPTDASGQLPATRKIDVITFIKAFAEGQADKYKGFEILGSGAGGSVHTVGNAIFTLIYVCARRPDGNYYAVEQIGPQTINVSFREDRVFMVKMELPSGSDTLSRASEMCRRFRARFNGNYVEATDTTGSWTTGGWNTVERLPVLVWESVEQP